MISSSSPLIYHLHDAQALPHLVSDAWSTDLLDQELSVLYNAASGALTPTLTELPIQYGDRALWQRALGGEALAPQVVY